MIKTLTILSAIVISVLQFTPAQAKLGGDLKNKQSPCLSETNTARCPAR